MRRVVEFKSKITPHIEFISSRGDLVEALDEVNPLDHQKSWATILEAIIEPLPEEDQPIMLLSGACHPKDVEKFFVVSNDKDKSLSKGTLSLSKALIKEFQGSKPMMVIFYLELMGTAASKYLLKFMNQLLNLKEMGADITFYWFYSDTDMRKSGEDIRNILGTTNFPVLKEIPIAEKQEDININ